MKTDRKAYMKAFNQSPKGKKSVRISRWKRNGIIVDDYDKFYDLYLSTANCEKCKKELTIDKQTTHSTKCVDHDHSINDLPNVRMICCNSCNVNDRSTNTSGEPNIHYNKRKKYWCFQKIIQGKHYNKSGFKTFEEALEYKKDYLSTLA